MTHPSAGEKFRNIFQSTKDQETLRTPRFERVEVETYLDDYRRCKSDLIKSAAFARDHAVSHRGFKVGCALMAVRADSSRGKYGIYRGFNVKQKSDEELKDLEKEKRRGAEKRCAERNAIEKALKGANAVIVALVTVSRERMTGDVTEQHEVASAHNVLHPCSDCRDMLQQLLQKGVLRGETIICNVNDKNGLEKKEEEEQTVDQLLRRYAKADKQKVA